MNGRRIDGNELSIGLRDMYRCLSLSIDEKIDMKESIDDCTVGAVAGIRLLRNVLRVRFPQGILCDPKIDVSGLSKVFFKNHFLPKKGLLCTPKI